MTVNDDGIINGIIIGSVNGKPLFILCRHSVQGNISDFDNINLFIISVAPIIVVAMFVKFFIAKIQARGPIEP